jgi:hypothetical protein
MKFDSVEMDKFLENEAHPAIRLGDTIIVVYSTKTKEQIHEYLEADRTNNQPIYIQVFENFWKSVARSCGKIADFVDF